MRAFVALGLVGAAVALSLLPQRSWAMTDYAEKDTSDTNAAGLDFSAIEINAEEYPAPVGESWPVESTVPISEVIPPADWPVEWPSDYLPWEDGYPTGYEPFEDNYPMDIEREFEKRVAAVLYMIKCCEHLLANIDACYGIFYSGISGFNTPDLVNQRFTDFRDHPVITGACRKVLLPPDTCRAVGLGDTCYSTAAGAYQIIRPTWDRIRVKGPRLPDFSPASQDAAAVRLLDECGALAKIRAGDMDGMLAKASRLWASLPGSTAQQNPKKVSYAMARYTEFLQA